GNLRSSPSSETSSKVLLRAILRSPVSRRLHSRFPSGQRKSGSLEPSNLSELSEGVAELYPTLSSRRAEIYSDLDKIGEAPLQSPARSAFDRRVISLSPTLLAFDKAESVQNFYSGLATGWNTSAMKDRMREHFSESFESASELLKKRAAYSKRSSGWKSGSSFQDHGATGDELGFRRLVVGDLFQALTHAIGKGAAGMTDPYLHIFGFYGATHDNPINYKGLEDVERGRRHNSPLEEGGQALLAAEKEVQARPRIQPVTLSDTLELTKEFGSDVIRASAEDLASDATEDKTVRWRRATLPRSGIAMKRALLQANELDLTLGGLQPGGSAESPTISTKWHVADNGRVVWKYENPLNEDRKRLLLEKGSLDTPAAPAERKLDISDIGYIDKYPVNNVQMRALPSYMGQSRTSYPVIILSFPHGLQPVTCQGGSLLREKPYQRLEKELIFQSLHVLTDSAFEAEKWALRILKPAAVKLTNAPTIGVSGSAPVLHPHWRMVGMDRPASRDARDSSGLESGSAMPASLATTSSEENALRLGRSMGTAMLQSLYLHSCRLMPDKKFVDQQRQKWSEAMAAVGSVGQSKVGQKRSQGPWFSPVSFEDAFKDAVNRRRKTEAELTALKEFSYRCYRLAQLVAEGYKTVFLEEKDALDATAAAKDGRQHQEDLRDAYTVPVKAANHYFRLQQALWGVIFFETQGAEDPSEAKPMMKWIVDYYFGGKSSYPTLYDAAVKGTFGGVLIEELQGYVGDEWTGVDYHHIALEDGTTFRAFSHDISVPEQKELVLALHSIGQCGKSISVLARLREVVSSAFFDTD
ncbi:unnamed protein product, partial [Amoebophrya sp. A25]